MSRKIANRDEIIESNKLHNQLNSKFSRLLVLDYNEYWGLFFISENRLQIIKALKKDSLLNTIIMARIETVKQDLNAAFVKLDKDTIAFIKLTNIPQRYQPIHQGNLLPVKIISDEQKGKKISVTANISKMNLPLGWEHKSAFSILSRPDNSLTKYIIENFSRYNIEKIITDSTEVYNILANDNDFYKKIEDRNSALEFYQDSKLSLLQLYSLKTKINESVDAKIYLKCGGYLIINHTEALTVIDVNSGKNTPGNKTEREKINLDINLEAAKEVALQMRLRNISGMILVDFINQAEEESNQLLIDKMNEYIFDDYVTVKVIDITPLGIMELTRQKKDKPLNEFIHIFSNK